VDFSQRVARVKDENHDLRTRLSFVKETLQQIQEFLKRVEDRGKVKGNFGTEALKKRKCVEIKEAGYCVAA
jgi:hypothetical protein